ncbi:MAG: deaminase [Candidatus Moraniibacteriota bacterium]
MKINRPSWDAYFMALAKLAASRSTCLSRPTGCIIVKNKQVISSGYNGSMPGVPHCSDEGKCYRRGIDVRGAEKYDFCRSIHAEANAIALAAKEGLGVDGAVAYMTLFPCYMCIKTLVRSGIKEIIYEKGYESIVSERDRRWKEALEETQVKTRKFEPTEKEKLFFCDFIKNITSERRLKSV